MCLSPVLLSLQHFPVEGRRQGQSMRKRTPFLTGQPRPYLSPAYCQMRFCFCSGRVTGRNPNSSRRAWAVKLWAVAQNRLVQPPRIPRSPVSRWLSPSPLTSVWGHPDAEHDFKATLGPLMPVMVTPHHTPRRKSQHQFFNLEETLDSFSPLSLLY